MHIHTWFIRQLSMRDRFARKFVICCLITLLVAWLLSLGVTVVVAQPYTFPIYVGETQLTQFVTPPVNQDLSLAEQSVFYQVTYPTGWQETGLSEPHCNPCDHDRDGVIRASDVHDHVATRPDITARHVFNVEPAYTGEVALDVQIQEVYLSMLPATSALQVNQLIASRLPDGSPVVTLTDLGFYFNSEISE